MLIFDDSGVWLGGICLTGLVRFDIDDLGKSTNAHQLKSNIYNNIFMTLRLVMRHLRF